MTKDLVLPFTLAILKEVFDINPNYLIKDPFPFGMNLDNKLINFDFPYGDINIKKRQIDLLLEERIKHLVNSEKIGNNEEEKLLNYTTGVVKALGDHALECLQLFYDNVPKLLSLEEELVSTLRESKHLDEKRFTEENLMYYKLNFLLFYIEHFFASHEELTYNIMEKVLLPLESNNQQGLSQHYNDKKIVISEIRDFKKFYHNVLKNLNLEGRMDREGIDKNVLGALKESEGVIEKKKINNYHDRQILYLTVIISSSLQYLDMIFERDLKLDAKELILFPEEELNSEVLMKFTSSFLLFSVNNYYEYLNLKRENLKKIREGYALSKIVESMRYLFKMRENSDTEEAKA